MLNRHYFREIYRAVGVTGGTVIVQLDRYPHDDIVHYTRIVVNDETSNGAVVDIKAGRAGVLSLIKHYAAFNANVAQTYDSAKVTLNSDEYLQVEFTGATDADVLKVYVDGYTDAMPSG